MDSRRASVASRASENEGTPRRSVKQVSAVPMHADSSQVKNLFNPIRGVRDEMLRNGITPRDHARDNLRAIREQSAKNKLRNQEPEPPKGFKARPAPPRRTVSQAAAVEALLAQHGAPTDAAERQALVEYYAAQLELERRAKEMEDEEDAYAAAGGAYGDDGADGADAYGGGGYYGEEEEDDGGYAAAMAAAQAQAGRGETDPYGGYGGGGGVGGYGGAPPSRSAAPQPRVSAKRSEYAPSEAPSRLSLQSAGHGQVGNDGIKKHSDYGRVPEYLKGRQAELAAAADAKRREEEAAAIPPGMRLVPEDERVQMLRHLEQSRAEVERQLGQLSLTSTTLRAKKERQAIEERLQEVEQGIKIFSRKTVWVHS